MNINPQTLRRRLRDEGCDYRQIKNELIRDMAIGYLTREDLEIKEIAYLLGFSEPSAFIRSFRKWTDTTPGSYRDEFAGKRAAAV
jgi:AraC-like DNA-binding protein